MTASVPLPYLQAYPPSLQQQAMGLVQSGQLGEWLLQRHPQAHQMRSDKALHGYVTGLKTEYMRNAAPLAKVVYDSKLQLVYQALGIHMRSGKNHGGKKLARALALLEVERCAVDGIQHHEFLCSCSCLWSRPALVTI